MNKRELSKLNRHKALARWSKPEEIEAARSRMRETMRKYWEKKKQEKALGTEDRHI